MLAGWAATPARFREDANAEQDAAGAGYADRLVIELAQNAADAAVSGAVPGRLLLRWTPDRLIAANTGAPLTDAGVLALSTLRASAKRGVDTAVVGRFGVGFAAVLAVTDSPSAGSAGAPGVAFSAAQTAALVAELPSVAADLAARGGHVPVLRLPFGCPPLAVPAGYDTVVELPWRDAAASGLARELLAGAGPELLLMLPGLEQLIVDGPDGRRDMRCSWDAEGALLDGRRWLLAAAAGPLPADLVAGVESAADRWAVRALAPADGQLAAGVLWAPTPTDEPLSLPVLLAASVPLEPTRRRVVRGPLADFVLARAGGVIAELAGRLPDPLPLVPTGLGAGDVDAAIRRAVSAALPDAPVLRGRRGRDCVLLELGAAGEATVALLAEEIDGLLPADWAAPVRATALRALGVRRWGTADVVEFLAGLHRPPPFWARAYAALAQAPDREALAALPVPLADGRLVTGVRGALLPGEGLPPGLAALPVRLVHPDAAHPLLAQLGAVPATPAGLLADPAVREAVEASTAGEDTEEGDLALARAICTLVRAAGASAADQPWLAALALPTVGGGREAAGDLLWPDGPMAALIDPAAGFAVLDPPDWLDRETAAALGVLDRPALLRLTEVPLDPDRHDPDRPGLLDLDGAEDWLAACAAAARSAHGANSARPDGDPARPDGDPAHPDGDVLPDVVAVRDLDAVADLPALLRLLAADPQLRAAIVEPVRVGSGHAPSYTAWWLGRHPVLDGALPADCALPGDPLLAGLFRPAPAGFDGQLLRALGVRSAAAELVADPDACGDLLDRLADAEAAPTRAQSRELYLLAARAWAHRLDQAPDPPLAVRAVTPDGRLAAVPSAQAVVVDRPDVLPLVLAAGRAVLPVPLSAAPDVAALLELDLAGELYWPRPGPGVRTPVPAVLHEAAGGPEFYQADEQLGVPWRWVDGELHATAAGLPAGLAWAAGAWSLRHLLTQLAAAPANAVALRLEADLDG
ncbi:MAG TPA: hypothetical protein VGN54_04265 [Mycobacteriales bacterium]|nr:hypothetical protein [Mycobacteriales bacterium]